jgi:YVTN family beta-propeller protein
MKYFKLFFLSVFLSTHLFSYPKVYVTSSNEVVSVLDAANNTFIRSFTPSFSSTTASTTASTLEGVAYSQGQQIAYIADSGNNGVWLIDVTTDTALNFIALAGANTPREIAINPLGTKVYISDGPANTVYVLNTSTLAVTTITPVVNAGPIAFSTVAPSRVYILNPANGVVRIYLDTTNTFIAQMPAAANAQFLAISSTNVGFAPNSLNTGIVTFNAFNGAITTPISTTPSQLRGVDFTPNGLTAYVASALDSNRGLLPVVSGVPSTFIQMLDLDNDPNRVLVNPLTPTQVYITTIPQSSVFVVENGVVVESQSFINNLTAANYMEYIFKVYPPTALSGTRIANKFALVTDFVNKLEWTASLSSSVTGYTISRNGQYLTTVTNTSYFDYNRTLGQTDTYQIRAIVANGSQSVAATVSVP